jgi:hypothetical protein
MRKSGNSMSSGWHFLDQDDILCMKKVKKH